MRRLVTGKQMKEIDAHAIQEVGIPSMVLMERAALACAEEMKKELTRRGMSPEDVRVLVLAGTGNNGADGVAIGRMLHLWGYQVTIACLGNPAHRTEEMGAQLFARGPRHIELTEAGAVLYEKALSLISMADDALRETRRAGETRVLHIGMTPSTIGLTGATGGKMKELSDILVNVPSTDTPRIQEAHITVGHIICELVEQAMFGGKK